MKCNKCGSEWNSTVKSEKCPFCGAYLLKDETNNTVTSVLKKVIEEKGPEVLKNQKLVKAYIMDCVKGQEKEKRLFDFACKAKVCEMFCDYIKTADSEKRKFIVKTAIKSLKDDYFMSEENARSIIEIFLEGIEGKTKIQQDAICINNKIGQHNQPLKFYSSFLSRIIVAIEADKSVTVYGDEFKHFQDISAWKNIKSVAVSSGLVVGLRDNGTVVAAADCFKCNTEMLPQVLNLRDLVSVSASASHVFGLKSDGTVVAIGTDEYGKIDVSDWNDIVSISANGFHIAGLKSDGTVVATCLRRWMRGQCEVDAWNDVVSVSVGAFHTVGLKSDGTVVAVGTNEYGECDVSDWNDIVSISAGNFHTVGLKSDGTVVAVGCNKNGECDVSDWDDTISVSAVGSITIALHSNGAVYGKGDAGAFEDDERAVLSDNKKLVYIR